MSEPQELHHNHPICRVVRAGWPDPLDTSFGIAGGGRWNPPGAYAVLYTCCSELVARAITRDLFRISAVTIEDLQPNIRPQLVDIAWQSDHVVDVLSAAGVATAGFPPDYPAGVRHDQTQPLAVAWHAGGVHAVLCRSASLERLGFSAWSAICTTCAELAIFTANSPVQPRLIRRRPGHTWLLDTPHSPEPPYHNTASEADTTPPA